MTLLDYFIGVAPFLPLREVLKLAQVSKECGEQLQSPLLVRSLFALHFGTAAVTPPPRDECPYIQQWTVHFQDDYDLGIDYFIAEPFKQLQNNVLLTNSGLRAMHSILQHTMPQPPPRPTHINMTSDDNMLHATATTDNNTDNIGTTASTATGGTAADKHNNSVNFGFLKAVCFAEHFYNSCPAFYCASEAAYQHTPIVLGIEHPANTALGPSATDLLRALGINPKLHTQLSDDAYPNTAFAKVAPDRNYWNILFSYDWDSDDDGDDDLDEVEEGTSSMTAEDHANAACSGADATLHTLQGAACSGADATLHTLQGAACSGAESGQDSTCCKSRPIDAAAKVSAADRAYKYFDDGQYAGCFILGADLLNPVPALSLKEVARGWYAGIITAAIYT